MSQLRRWFVRTSVEPVYGSDTICPPYGGCHSNVGRSAGWVVYDVIGIDAYDIAQAAAMPVGTELGTGIRPVWVHCLWTDSRGGGVSYAVPANGLGNVAAARQLPTETVELGAHLTTEFPLP